jgi:L-amino acid N-acyltransferase YncA
MNQFLVRPICREDAPELAELINEIIGQGGTTAFEVPFTAEGLAEQYLTGPNLTSAVVALDVGSGRPEGFQILGDFGAPLPRGWTDIGTYVRPSGKQRGIGSTLFAATRERARELGLIAINATIRADNHGGLTFYAKLGFEDYAVQRAIPLADGTRVDRIRKRYWLKNKHP